MSLKITFEPELDKDDIQEIRDLLDGKSAADDADVKELKR